jgi:hypothetical protein
MGDSYEALIDCQATQGDAELMRSLIVECLSESDLIVPVLSADCVLDGEGYPASPRCAAAYPLEQGEGALHPNEFWTLRTNGVEIYCGPWINMFGFHMFDCAECPHCQHRYGEDFLAELNPMIDAFSSAGVLPTVTCAGCSAHVRLHDWRCEPHLGFVNLAIVFYNWPPLDDDGWKLNVSGIIEAKLGRPLVRTYGRI